MDKKDFKILIVDDDAWVGQIVKDLLSLNGYVTRYVDSSIKALESLIDETCHLFILDIDMPGMSGIELLQKLDVGNRTCATIMLTGLTDLGLARKAMELGAFSYILKPFQGEDLLLQVGKALELVELEISKEQYQYHLEEMVSARTTQLEKEIRERKLVEATLRKSEGKYRTIIESMGHLIFILDEQNQVSEYYVPGGENLLNLLGNIIGKSYKETLPSGAVELYAQSAVMLRGTGKNQQYEYRLNFDGASRWFCASLHLHADRKSVIAVIRDITERKRAEEQIRMQLDELSHMSRVATMGELATSLAHEINQPLAAILCNAQAALRFVDAAEPHLEDVREALKDIVDDDQRAGNVIKELRALMKKEEPHREMLDMIQVIDEVLILTKSDLVIKNGRIRKEYSPGLPPVYGSRVQMQQVVINLVNNGCEAMEETGPAEKTLTIRAFATPPNITVEITDCGNGLKHGMSEKVFEPYFTTKQKGLGMGLPICRSIIEAHGGNLTTRNNPDKGATFSFTLPAEGAKT